MFFGYEFYEFYGKCSFRWFFLEDFGKFGWSVIFVYVQWGDFRVFCVGLFVWGLIVVDVEGFREQLKGKDWFVGLSEGIRIVDDFCVWGIWFRES